MRTLYVILLFVLLGAFWAALEKLKGTFKVLTPILGWMVGLGYFVIIPWSILTLRGRFRYPAIYAQNGVWGDVDLSRAQFLGPWIFIWLSLMLACAAAYFCCPAPTAKRSPNAAISRLRLERVILFLIACTALEWVATIWVNGGIEQFLVSHWYHRQDALIERFGLGYIVYMHATSSLQILLTGAAALYTGAGLKNRDTRWKFTSLIVFTLVVGMMLHGNRIFFAIYLLALLVSCWLYGRKKILITLLMVSPLVVLIFSAWAWVRQDLSSIPESVGTNVIDADMDNRAVTSLMDATEGANLLLLMHIIGDFGNKYDYLYGSTYSRLLTFFEPRILNPERTESFTIIAAKHYEPGELMSLNSTALGEASANFGILGVFVPPLFTWLALRYSQWLHAGYEKHALVSAVSFVMFIWFARSTFAENAFTLIGAALLIRVFGLEQHLWLSRLQPPTVAITGGNACST
ncbi:MAG TPA: O-antigen polymerase [Candidatus Limnocylindria bacterium]|nr:O-antigen polymerase [Candidatus Limnocylindria bacterium]